MNPKERLLRALREYEEELNDKYGYYFTDSMDRPPDEEEQEQFRLLNATMTTIDTLHNQLRDIK